MEGGKHIHARNKQEQCGKPMELVGVRTGGPGHQKSPLPAFSHLMLRHKTQQQIGRGREVSLHTCQELEREAGTGGGDRGWWGQNLEKGEGPRKGTNLGDGPGLREGHEREALSLGRDEEPGQWAMGF